MVEQSSTTKSEEADMDYDVFTEEELEVCQTLIELEGLILKSDFRDCWPLTWGAKKRLVWGTTKKRSSIDSGTAAVAPPPPPPPQKTTATTVVQVKVEAKSPSTPLAFSPSTESDDKSKHCHRKISKKRTRDELLKMVNELTENKIALRGELERVKNHYNEVLAYNKDLKAMKKQIESTMICQKREEPKSDRNQNYNLGLSLGRNYQISLVPLTPHHHHPHHQAPPPMVVDPRAAAEAFHHYAQITPPLFSSNSGLGMVNQMGPLSNNNISSSGGEGSCRMESFQPLDYTRAFAIVDQKRARCAEARRERQMKMKQIKHTKKIK